jgi:hypothetical protein
MGTVVVGRICSLFIPTNSLSPYTYYSIDSDNLDNWFPSEKGVKAEEEEEEEVKYSNLLDAIVGSLEEFDRVISKRRKRGVCVKHGEVKQCSS